MEGVESILDHMLIAVSDDLGDEGPSRTVLFIKLQHIDIFRRSPFSFCDSGIQMADPSFAALMRSPQKTLLKQTKRNQLPIDSLIFFFSIVSVNQCLNSPIFLDCPSAALFFDERYHKEELVPQKQWVFVIEYFFDSCERGGKLNICLFTI